MTTANNRIRTRNAAVAIAVFAVVVSAVTSAAGAHPPVVVSPVSADVRVWVDGDWDVYPSYDEVVFSIRAARGCYATVFLVDTEGYVHVLHPYSPYDNAWLEPGMTYRYSGHDIGLGVLAGRGVAYIFAVGSPYPFDYSDYGEAIFFGRFGYRIHGDPYVAFRQLYVSLLPVRCEWDRVGVSYARFYVRKWVRYPRYLCFSPYGGTVHVRVGDYCHRCCQVYDRYRAHFNDPYDVIRPHEGHRAGYKDEYVERTQIERTRAYKKSYQNTRPTAYKTKTHVQSAPRAATSKASMGRSKIVSAKRSNSAKSVGKTAVNTTRRTTGASAKTSAGPKATRSKSTGNVTVAQRRTSSVAKDGRPHTKTKTKTTLKPKKQVKRTGTSR